MADYASAAMGFKARVDAVSKKALDYHIFFEELRKSLVIEAEKANSALTYENAPQIEFKIGQTEGAVIQMGLDAATSTIKLDRDKLSVMAEVKSTTGERTVTYLIDEENSPFKAQRVSLSPSNEVKVGPSEIAAVFVEELITGAP